MTLQKRFLDIVYAMILTPFLVPAIAVFSLIILIQEGRPIFYGAERMKTPTRPFTLWKFRTMTVDPNDSGVSGGDKSARITRIGRFLRKTRMDEFPQLWNLYRGDITFVGPRPPLRQYVERFPDIYAQVLRSRPGITGLASIYYGKHEARLLRACRTPEETDAVYCRRCIPRKATLDLMYQRRQTICLDGEIILKTFVPRLR